MTTITLENPSKIIKKTSFKDEKEMIMYFINITNYDYIDFQELSEENISGELKELVQKSKQKNISDFDNI